MAESNETNTSSGIKMNEYQLKMISQVKNREEKRREKEKRIELNEWL